MSSRSVLENGQDADAAAGPEAAADNSYDFRLYLIPHTGPPSEADAAMTFVRLEDLDAEQWAQVDAALTIIREKQVPASNFGRSYRIRSSRA